MSEEWRDRKFRFTERLTRRLAQRVMHTDVRLAEAMDDCGVPGSALAETLEVLKLANVEQCSCGFWVDRIHEMRDGTCTTCIEQGVPL